jgi:hypothetical protein
MIHDFHSYFVSTPLILPAVLAADNTPIEVDLQPYTTVGLLLHVGIGGITFSTTNKIEFKLLHGDTSGSLVAVDDNDVEGATVASGGIIKNMIAAHAAAAVYPFSYVGGKRYIHLLADFSGTHGTGTGIYAAVVACPMVSANVTAPKTGKAA